jgi:exopolysaccharide biosynthesis protein/3',5'-cyclic AMP phosphodiesterase CpdA
LSSPLSPRPRRRSRLSAALLVAAGLAALPTAAHAADQLTLTDKTETIGPGITLQHLKTLSASGWLDEQVLTADLSDPAVSSDLLTAGPVAQGGPISVAANKAGAVAAVNGDFFDIDNSQAPLGVAIQDGTLLKSPQASGWPAVGVGKDGLGRLIDATLDATATVHGVTYKVATVNAANSSLAANSMVAFTSNWGTYTRKIGTGGATDVAEALVKDGEVVSVDATGAGDGAIPEGAFVLVGTGTQAAAIRTFQPGDKATLSYALKDDVAKNMKFALGANTQLVKDGQALPSGDPSNAPRTAIGFKDGGKTMILATADGRQTTVPGPTLTQWGQILKDLGAETAMNLDGGGSTTMVARPLGDFAATVRNTPSDGHERNDPDGVGLFVAPGDGQVHDLVVQGADQNDAGDDQPRVFPGLHRTLTAKAVDDHQTPVRIARGDVRWSAIGGGQVDNGQLAAPADATGTITVRATTDTAQQDAKVRVLHPLDRLELSSARLSFAGTGEDEAQTLTVTGRDDQGYTAPVEAEDLDLDYDRSVVKIQPSGAALKVVPLKAGGTVLTVKAGGRTEQLAISVGVQTVDAYDFGSEKGVENKRWKFTGTATANPTLTDTADGLQVDFSAARNIGITANGSGPAVQVLLPGQPLKVRVHVYSNVAMSLTYLSVLNGGGTYTGIYSTPLKDTGWQDVEFTIPASTKFPISFDTFQGIETTAANQKAGRMVVGSVSADIPSPVDQPAQDPLHADRLVSADGALPSAGQDWTFATLSDIQFTADNPTLAQAGIAAIQRIRKTHPDLLVLNGDVTDRGLPQDLTLARQTLEEAGCDIVKVGEEPAPDSTPDPNGKLPCYYVPGNHESYGLNNVQSDLTNFTAEFGRPYRTFDHKGTRFVLLASSLGSLRGTDYSQLPMLQKALDDAQSDPSIDNVMVFAHHPVDDPADTKSSQLGDRDEVKLIEKLLSDFRDASGKGAAMVGSHAQIADVHRVQGVPYVVLPSSGKDPYGTPDRGGFTGWMRWAVDPAKNADGQWLTADVRAFAQSITLNAPETVEVSQSATLSGSIVQPEGVANGTRVVPLRYPMSVHWSGDDGLAIGSGQAAIDAARAAGKVAILDPRTQRLTGLRAGKVAVVVTNDSLRPYTDDAPTAPVTTQKTVRVVPYTGSGPRLDVATPVFPDQIVGTISAPQRVVIANTGDRPLHVSSLKVQDADGASAGDFVLADESCTKGEIAPGASCAVLVRFAPSREKATSHERLVIADDTAERGHVVDLTGTSIPSPAIGEKGDKGDVGPQGPVGPVGPQGPQGDTGAKGDAGATGAIGPVGPVGATGAKGDKGDKGDPGRDAEITCKIKTTSRKQGIACSVTYVGAEAKTRSAKTKAASTIKASKATLTRLGRTYAKGLVGHLTTTRKLVRGAYSLRVTSGAGRHKATTIYRITLR